MLNRIQIEGFKSIKSMDLELQPLNLLIGPNGAGKSNFIQLFHFIRHLQEKNLQFYVSQQPGADRILHFGRKRTDELRVSLKFSPNGYVCSLVPTTSGGLVFREESCSFFADEARIREGLRYINSLAQAT